MSLKGELEQLSKVLGLKKMDLASGKSPLTESYAAAAERMSAKSRLFKEQAKDKEVKALVWQLLEQRIEAEQQQSCSEFATKLNAHLRTCSYLVQGQLTVADFLVYFALKPFISGVAPLDRQHSYPNLCRWMAFVQTQSDKVAQSPVVMKNLF